MNIYQYTNISLVKLFKSLADETRLRIFRVLLKGSFHVNEILFILNQKQSNISHHLKILQESGLISNKKEGSLIYYHLKEKYELKSNEKIISAIQTEEESLPFFQEDSQRLQTVLQKRQKNAVDFFNSIGKDLDSVQDKLFKDIYKIEDAVKLFNNKMNTILDIGCGTGRNLPILAKYSNKVAGIDSSPGMLQLSEHICHENKLNYELKLGDINSLPFSAKSIDGVFINMVLHHVSNINPALKEVSRVLTDKGKILLIELLTHNNEFMREKYADLWLGFNEDELIEWLKQANFTIKEKLIKQGSDSNPDSKKFKVIIIMAEKNLKT